MNNTQTGQIFFCGDVHGHFDHIIDAVRTHLPAAIVLLGDVQAQKPLEQSLAGVVNHTQVWFNSSPKGRAGLRIREWVCSSCGSVHDRDVNAARNILAVGHGRLAGGIPVLTAQAAASS